MSLVGLIKNQETTKKKPEPNREACWTGGITQGIWATDTSATRAASQTNQK